jgi:hypothetical protein
VVCVAIGTIGYAILPKTYESKVEFFLRNPFYTDRNALYNNDRYIDYFASDDEMNRLIAMSQADSLQNRIIREFHLVSAYRYDSTDLDDLLRTKRKFGRSLNIWRTENKSLELSYEDKDRIRAARVANRAVALLEQGMRGFYNDTRITMYETIMGKVTEEDSMIDMLTDSLAILRERYGIYDIISPSRHNIMLSSMKYNGKGMEQIQNIESMKDQLVTDRARQFSLANQYTTGDRMNALPLIHVVRSAQPAYKPLGSGMLMMGLSAGLAGFFFAVGYVLISGFYRKTS